MIRLFHPPVLRMDAAERTVRFKGLLEALLDVPAELSSQQSENAKLAREKAELRDEVKRLKALAANAEKERMVPTIVATTSSVQQDSADVGGDDGAYAHDDDYQEKHQRKDQTKHNNNNHSALGNVGTEPGVARRSHPHQPISASPNATAITESILPSSSPTPFRAPLCW